MGEVRGEGICGRYTIRGVLEEAAVCRDDA